MTIATVVSLTPFDEDGALDEDGLRAHLRRLGDAGVRVYLGAGPGEWYVLSPLERRRTLEIGVEVLGGSVPVMAMGVEPRSAAEMIDFVELADDVGVDGVQIYSLELGHGHDASTAEWERYVCEVLERTTLPATLSVHFSVGYLPPVDVVARVVDRYDQVVGVNATPTDLLYLVALVEELGDRVEIHIGGPLHAPTARALGAHGFLNFEGNIAPQLTADVAADGPSVSSRAFRTLIQLYAMIGRHGWVPPTKEALRQLGLPGGHVRPPLLPVSATARDDIRHTLGQLDIPELAGLTG